MDGWRVFGNCWPFFFSREKTDEKQDPPVVIKRWRIWKNLIVICLAWVLLFTAFQGKSVSTKNKREYPTSIGISNLQSSLNVEGDVGMNSMAIIYAFLIFSSALLPHPMVNFLSNKRRKYFSLIRWVSSEWNGQLSFVNLDILHSLQQISILNRD